MMPNAIRVMALATALGPMSSLHLLSADWPQWRFDAGRTAVTDETLPKKLHLLWSRALPAPRPAWPASQKKLRFDVSYEPVAMGKGLFVPSTVTDSVTAYDTETGVEKWGFHADGPVRFAPVAFNNKVYFASDDGCLYCVSAKDGALIRKIHGGPTNEKVIGNDRLVGMWPARGGPVLKDGIIYFAAGIWPFMGVFIHALDAESGELLWTNSNSSSLWTGARSKSFTGVAPQGYLAASEKMVIVPSGRTMPAFFDCTDGRLDRFEFGFMSGGGYAVSTRGEWFFHDGGIYKLDSGERPFAWHGGVIGNDAAWLCSGGRLQSIGFPPLREETVDRRGRKRVRFKLKTLTNVSVNPHPDRILLKAGPRLYGQSGKLIVAIDVEDIKTPAVSWQHELKSIPTTMLAADGKLFVVTKEGGLYCFGGEKKAAKSYTLPRKALPKADDVWTGRAKSITKVSPDGGYCVALGIGSGRLIEELLKQSSLKIIAVDPDVNRVTAFRKRMHEAGLYGTRVTAHTGDPFDFGLPPYLASMLVSESLAAAGFKPEKRYVDAILTMLRPYGGTAYFRKSGNLDALVKKAKDAEGIGCEVSEADGVILIWRAEGLIGSAPWTHQNADAANTRISKDKRVMAPLGLLWFGGPPNDPVLPRHGHGPTPQVIGGRLFIEGDDLLRAVDVYTGRLLWEKQLPGVGTYYAHLHHHPGANKIGSNYVSTKDAVYLIKPQACLVLDPATGKTKKKIELPAPRKGEKANWGFITVWDKFLIAAASPLGVDAYSLEGGDPDKAAGPTKLEEIPIVTVNDRYASSSRELVVFDRKRGAPLWKRAARYSFRHNTIIAGDGKVFCIDGITPRTLAALKRRGYSPKGKATLYALEALTGKVIWKTEENVFGTWLAYSKEHDVLLQAGSAFRDRALDEARAGMVAYRGKDGHVLWTDLELRYGGPPLIHHDRIITNGNGGIMLDLNTGQRRTRTNPITGMPTEWFWTRNYGCNTAIGSEHLLTFRSGDAGYFDLKADSGTGSLGGFRAGCTSNLIPADGVLNAPDYTRTCTCSYQNQCSLALIHNPNVEMWTRSRLSWPAESIRSLGINLGAPGDRSASNGTLWLEYPAVSDPLPEIPLQLEPRKTKKWRDNRGREKSESVFAGRVFRHHASLFSGKNLNWVGSSGVEGLNKLVLTVSKEGKQPLAYTVRLVFAEPLREARQGERVFDVSVQGRNFLTDFDIVRQAGAPKRVITKEIKGVRIAGDLELLFFAKVGKPLICGVEIIAEERDP